MWNRNIPWNMFGLLMECTYSICIPFGFHRVIPHGFHVNSMEWFQMESMWIPDGMET
jgi:hypothetical protein